MTNRQRSGFDREYGVLTIRRKHYIAHRLAYALAHGIAYEDLPKVDCCHTCNRPLCVLPEHLYLGTRRQNLEQMVRDGRSLKGERNAQAKLTRTQVDEMRERAASGEDYTSLSAVFGVHYQTVYRIVRRKLWR